MIGCYTYICRDCKEKFKLTRTERASRFRPRCRFCGSLHLDPVKKELVKSRTDLHTVALRIRKEKFQRLNTISYNRKKN